MFSQFVLDVLNGVDEIVYKFFQPPDSKYYRRKYHGYKHYKDNQLIINETKAEIV